MSKISQVCSISLFFVLEQVEKLLPVPFVLLLSAPCFLFCSICPIQKKKSGCSCSTLFLLFSEGTKQNRQARININQPRYWGLVCQNADMYLLIITIKRSKTMFCKRKLGNCIPLERDLLQKPTVWLQIVPTSALLHSDNLCFGAGEWNKPHLYPNKKSLQYIHSSFLQSFQNPHQKAGTRWSSSNLFFF